MYEVLHQNYHMQGFATDGDFLYWSFTDSLVKTNKNNTVIAQTRVLEGHLGDITYHDGKIYGTVMGDSLAGRPWGVWTSFHVYVYDAESLALQKTIRLDCCYDMYAEAKSNGGFNGVDGIVIAPGKSGELSIWTACALFSDVSYVNQMLLEFSMNGRLLEIHKFETGNTLFGIQNLDYEADRDCFWITTYYPDKEYQSKDTIYCLNAKAHTVEEKYEFYSPYGFCALGGGKYLASIQSGVNGNRQGYAYEADKSFISNGPKTEEEAQALIK